MVSIDEMKECIQEWLAQCRSPVDLAMTYADCRMELDFQLKFCMDMLWNGVN